MYKVKHSDNRTFSHDVTSAILEFKKNETAAMLVFQTNPVGVEHFCIDASHVIKTALRY